MQSPTKNAIARYLIAMKTLGLPGLGTEITAGGKTFRLAGLSSDAQRVKANVVPTGELVDLKLNAVLVVLGAMHSALESEDKAVTDVAAAKIVLSVIAAKKKGN
jgi:hypothetical protein